MEERRVNNIYDVVRCDERANTTSRGPGKRMIAGVVILALLLAGVIFALWYFVFRSSSLTFAKELKLDVYNSIDSNISDAICNQDEKTVSDWAVDVVGKTIEKNRSALKDIDRDAVVESIEKNIKIVMSAGHIEKDGAELSDLSKSYVANAVANAISYSVPKVDFDATVDTGNTSYRQVLDMQETLNNLELQNDSLVKMVSNLNQMMGAIGVNSGTGISQDDVQAELDALQTQLTANMYAYKDSEITDNDKSNSKVKVINTTVDINASQDEIIKKLQYALEKIKELAEELDKLKNNTGTDSSTNSDSSMVTMKETIATLQKQLEELKEKLKATSDKICKDVETGDSGNKESITKLEKLLETKVIELQTEIKNASEEEKKNLQNKIDELNKIIEANKKSSDEEDKKLSDKVDKDIKDLTDKTNKDVKDLTDKTDKDIKDLTDKTDKSIKDLTDKTDKNIKDLSDKTDKSIKDLTDKTDKDIKDLTDKTAESIKSLSDETSKAIQDLSDSTARSLKELSDAVQEKFDEVNVTISQLRSDMNTLVAELDSKIDANSDAIRDLQKRFERYAAANDGHSKIDVILGFTIYVDSGDHVWSVLGDKATCTIASEFFKDSILVDIDYADSYDITPEYTIDTIEGTLVISIPAEQVEEISIKEIVVYHTVMDDTPEVPETPTEPEIPTEPIEPTEPTELTEGAESTEGVESTEGTGSTEVKANGDEGGENYSQLDKESAEEVQDE